MADLRGGFGPQPVCGSPEFNMTRESLETQTRKALALLARQQQIAGWHAMRKEELIRVLLSTRRPCKPPLHSRVQARSRTTRDAANGREDDQLIAIAQGPYWVKVQWNLTPEVVGRARASLGVAWHQSVAVIRVFAVGGEVPAASRTCVRDVEIHGEADCWYIPVEDLSGKFRFAIGYRAPSGKFFAMACSPVVQTPRPGEDAPLNGHPHDATPGRGPVARFSRGLAPRPGTQDPQLRVEADVVVRGSAHPGAEVTCMGRRVEVAADGTFLLRIPLPNGRQVIPASAVVPGCPEEQTVILAIERNTKELEPRNLNETWF
jgi:hypothetical protein